MVFYKVDLHNYSIFKENFLFGLIIEEIAPAQIFGMHAEEVS